MLLVVLLCLPGCGKVYDYELERLADICGGYEELKKVWLGYGVPRAICQDGTSVRATQPAVEL